MRLSHHYRELSVEWHPSGQKFVEGLPIIGLPACRQVAAIPGRKTHMIQKQAPFLTLGTVSSNLVTEYTPGSQLLTRHAWTIRWFGTSSISLQ